MLYFVSVPKRRIQTLVYEATPTHFALLPILHFEHCSRIGDKIVEPLPPNFAF
jgi:hypothetical protein